MKKIFAISFLSLMAVTGGARAEVEQYNLNLATAQYVDDIKEQLDNNKVSTWRVAESDETVTDNNKDFYIPTIARVDAAIANAKPDTSGLVEKAQVVTSDGVDMDGNDISSELTPDQVVPTVANVEANFVPNEAVDYYNGAMWGNSTTMREPGAYLLMVVVDENGNKSYRWVATQIGLYSTSAGEIAG